MKRLPTIHGRRELEPGRGFRVEEVDLEFSNGERRQFQRLHSAGLGAVIVVPMQDDDTVLLVREYAAGQVEVNIRYDDALVERPHWIVQSANCAKRPAWPPGSWWSSPASACHRAT